MESRAIQIIVAIAVQCNSHIILVWIVTVPSAQIGAQGQCRQPIIRQWAEETQIETASNLIFHGIHASPHPVNHGHNHQQSIGVRRRHHRHHRQQARHTFELHRALAVTHIDF